MPKMIRQGDTTSHGGTVLEGFSLYQVEGRAVAGLGHKVACPKCKGVFPITQGNPAHMCNGVPLAYHGMTTACGATLIASQGSTEHSLPVSSPVEPAGVFTPDQPTKQPEEKKVQFVFKHAGSKDAVEQAAHQVQWSDDHATKAKASAEGKTKEQQPKKEGDPRVSVLGHRFDGA